jgi:very-long-chain (3R)-3-hydroxyacyl-CoA dehydratase
MIWLVQVPIPRLCDYPAYTLQLIPWALTEVIRYSYLACKLSGFEPTAFTWLRYTAWIILYPTGIAGEWIQMWRSVVASKEEGLFAEQGLGLAHQFVMAVCFFIIWPWGAYQLLPHMARQRRKVMAELKTKDNKATQ